MVDQKKETKEQLLLRRVFNVIDISHFNDHKMTEYYIEGMRFPRSLGDDIADYIQGRYPEVYHKKRKELEGSIA